MRPNWIQKCVPTNESIIKIIFAVHFGLVAWLLETRDLSGDHKTWHLIFYNAFLFITLLWSLIQPRSCHPTQLAAIVEFVCIGVDTRVICRLHVVDGTWFFPYEFSVWYVSLFIRVVSFVALWQLCRVFCPAHGLKQLQHGSRHHGSKGYSKKHPKKPSIPLSTITEEVPLQESKDVTDVEIEVKETV